MYDRHARCSTNSVVTVALACLSTLVLGERRALYLADLKGGRCGGHGGLRGALHPHHHYRCPAGQQACTERFTIHRGLLCRIQTIWVYGLTAILYHHVETYKSCSVKMLDKVTMKFGQ